MPEPPACTRMLSPPCSLALSNSMCSTVEKAIGAQAASRKATPGGTGTVSRAGVVDQLAGKAVDVEAHHVGDVLAQIVAAFATGAAGAAGERAVHHHRVAGLEARRIRAECGDLARRLGADHQRQLALGERHAAEAPHVDVVERHRLDADLQLARAGGGRRWQVGQLELAIGDEGERMHP